MKIKSTLFLGLIAFGTIVFLPFFTIAQSVSLNGQVNIVSTAVPFLAITPDSRSGALGGAGVALPPDANASYWNASKLAFATDDLGLSLSYVPWLRALVPDINLSYLSGYKRIDNLSSFGASLRYFSLGDITFTDDKGQTLVQNYRPNEFAVDGFYARKLSSDFSLGLTLRFIYSDLTGGTPINGTQVTKPGIAYAGDLSGFWKLHDFKIKDKTFNMNLGICISNIGSKITYTDETQKDFIPCNLRIGTYINYNIDEYNQLGLTFDLNKLLVPTPPIYQDTTSSGNINGTGNLVILKGKNPNVPVIQGMIQSFTDAPGGLKEEIQEIDPAIGLEYWYNKQIAGRIGYFYEAPTKGDRQYFTVGIGVKYSILNLDVSYLIPTASPTASQTSPLAKTMQFTLIFNFGKKK